MVAWCLMWWIWVERSELASGAGRVVEPCCWARLITPTVPLSTQDYKWILRNKILERNPAIRLAGVSTKLQPHSNVASISGVMKSLISQC